MFLNTPTTATLQAIPEGVPGVKATLKAMKELVKQGKQNIKVRMTAVELTNGLLQKDFAGEVRKLHAFVRDRIRYLKDIRDVETLHTADKILEIGQGDCDDKSVLLASLLESIGHPTRFVAISLLPGKFCHVYVETKIGAKWVALESTEPVPPGWQPRCHEKLVIHN